MSIFLSAQTGSEKSLKTYYPFITVACIFVSIFLFGGINLDGGTDTWEGLKKWGAPSPGDLFGGHYYGLITSSFLHVDLWHIALNVYWFWIFGKRIELELGKVVFLLFVLTCAIVSSLAQLAFSDSTGIGLSGIVYGMFGFLWVIGRKTEKHSYKLPAGTINLFLVWLVLCVVLTKTRILDVANAAHFGGMLWGCLLAYAANWNLPYRWLTGFTYIVTLILLVMYGPFSTSYLSYRALELHQHQKLEEAADAYRQILGRDGNNAFASENLRGIEIYFLSKKAVELHGAGEYNEARMLYDKILAMDTANEWAKENLRRLPNIDLGSTRPINCETKIDSLSNKLIYSTVEHQAKIRGSFDELFEDLGKIRLPKNPNTSQISLFISIIVNEDGEVSDLFILGAENNLTLQEQLVSLFKRYEWQPAMCDGRKVRSRLVVRVVS